MNSKETTTKISSKRETRTFTKHTVSIENTKYQPNGNENTNGISSDGGEGNAATSIQEILTGWLNILECLVISLILFMLDGIGSNSSSCCSNLKFSHD